MFSINTMMMHELNRTFNQTIVMITHNPEAAAVANRLIEMRDGQIVLHQHDDALGKQFNL